MANRCMECGVKRVPCPCEEEQKHIDDGIAEALAADRARIAAAIREEMGRDANPYSARPDETVPAILDRLLRVVEGG